jgi:hypothetical protein
LAKPNYQREKRQKELNRKKKKEEKKLRKQEKTDVPPQSGPDFSGGQSGNG